VSYAVWRSLGPVSYGVALDIQERVASERSTDARPDTLLLLEHPPTITLGRRAGAAEVLWAPERLAAAGIEAVSTGRGGRATYHGPGQLVGYPIVRLPRGGRAVRDFVERLEAVLLEAASAFGVRAQRRPDHPGAWIGRRKLASLGIAVRRGITRHGFALNVDMDLAPFQAIVPCGVPGLEFTDLSRATGARVALDEAARAVVRAWRAQFGAIEEERDDVREAAG
jgi:lipoate-protein ligase B